MARCIIDYLAAGGHVSGRTVIDLAGDPERV